MPAMKTPVSDKGDHEMESLTVPIDVVEGGTTFEGGNKPTDSRDNTVVPNKFIFRRNMTQGLYDVALLMANVSQLKSVLDSESHKHYTLLLGLLGASISLHIIGAILLYVLIIVERNEQNREALCPENQNNDKGQTTCRTCSESTCKCWKIYKIDCIATACVFGVTIINIFITAFASDLSVKR